MMHSVNQGDLLVLIGHSLGCCESGHFHWLEIQLDFQHWALSVRIAVYFIEDTTGFQSLGSFRKDSCISH